MSFQSKIKKRAAPILVGLTAMPLVLSACGGGSSGGGADKAQIVAATGPVQEVRVEMGDFFYKPGDIAVKSGKIKFTLVNVGATAHRFSVKSGGAITATSKNVGAGREAVLEIDLAPGKYSLGCTLGDHEARGAAGTLTVK